MANNTISVLLTAVDQLSGPLGTAAGKLDKFAVKAEAIGRTLEGLGTRIGGIGIAGQAGLAQLDLDIGTLARGAIDTEKALYGIANTAGMSGAQAKAMVNEWSIAMNQIAVATNKSQAEVTQAFNDLVAKGMDPKVASQQLVAIGRAATAAGADIADMASAANASLANMGVDAARSLEIMAQAGKSGAFELRDMAQYFDLLTVKSSLLGQKGAEGMASLAAAAQIARKGAGDASTAANNLANFLDKLSAPVTAGAFKKFGLNLGEEVKKGLASGDLIGYMAETIQKATGGDAAKLSQLFADVQAKNFIAPMLQNLDEYKRIRDEALSAKGVVDKDFETAMNSTASALDAMSIAASASVQNSGALKDLVSALKSVSQWVAENPDTAKYLIFGTAAATAGGAVIVGIGATVTAISTIIPALKAVAVFAAANPITLALMGVAVAGGMVWYNWDDIVAGVKLAWGDIKNAVGGALEYVAEKYESWKQAGATLVQKLKDGIADGLKGALGIGQKLTEAIAYLKNEGAKWMQVGKDIMQGLLDGIQTKYKEIIGKLKGLGKDMLDSVKDVLGIKSPSRVMAEVGQNIGSGLVVGMENSLPTVQDAAEKLAEVVVVSSSTRPRNADGSFKSLADAAEQGTGMAGGIKEYIASIKDFSSEAKDMVVNAFKGMEDALVNFVKTGKLDFKSLTNSIIDDLIRIQIQQSITKPLAAAMGSVNLASLFGFANGGAPGGVSAWRNQVVSKPTFFAFANGGVMGGVMGEAGPEAIMPLTRKNGRLGVDASGAAPAQNITVNQTIQIDSRSDQSVILAAMARAKQEAVAAINQSLARGGTTARLAGVV